MGDGGTIWGFEVRDREWDFLIESHDLKSFRRGDGETGVKEVDSIRFAGDVKIVKVAEELRRSFSNAEAGPGTSGGLLIDGFKHFESGGDPFAFFVEHQSTVFHAARSEEADVTVTREFLGGAAGRDVGGRRRGRVTRDGADGVKMVGYERFVGDEEE